MLLRTIRKVMWPIATCKTDKIKRIFTYISFLAVII